MNFIKQEVKAIIRNHFINLRGFRTDRKIVVIESDDWGAVRSPSLDVVENLEKRGFDSRKSHYMRNDSLASEEDLGQLFRMLKSVEDCKGKTPVITANTILANPDFEKIRESGFSAFYFEWFTETLKRYPEHRNSFDLWRQGQSDGYFYPQLHGREHLQVQRWMRDLRVGNTATLAAFDVGYYGLGPINSPMIKSSYLPAFDYDRSDELSFIADSVHEAASKFEELFGYKSTSFVAPNYVWNHDIEKVLLSCGVKYIQTGGAQFLPKIDKEKNKYIRHYMGESNTLGQNYLVRNCSFEPSSSHKVDWVEKCMEEIGVAFLWRKPAIIESHRVNYVGFLNKKNRDRSLKLLGKLFGAILKKWPDVEFMSSDRLGDYMMKTQRDLV